MVASADRPKINSSRRLGRETQRNLELIWLTCRLAPDFKTIADFRKDNGLAIRRVCRQFVDLCRSLNLFSEAIVAIDGSKFKAVNNRDTNVTDRKLAACMQRLEESVGRYLDELDRADREPAAVSEGRVFRRKQKMTRIKDRMQRLSQIGVQMQTAPDRQISLTDPAARSMATSGIAVLVPKPPTSNRKAAGRFDKHDFICVEQSNEYQCPVGQRAIYRFSTIENGLMIKQYWSSACLHCKLKAGCTTSKYRRITRWEHEDVLERMQARLDRTPEASRLRRQTVAHTFGTLKAWMGATHFLTRTLPRVSTEMSLHVLACNLKRMARLFGAIPLMSALMA